MKSYTITVNGNVYQVTVEENTGAAPAAMPQAAAPVPAAPAAPAPAAPAPAAPAPAAAPASSGGGSIEITSPVPGKIFKIVAEVGKKVAKGDNILILESMKMEIPVVAPENGTVVSIDVTVGAAIESGDILATMNA